MACAKGADLVESPEGELRWHWLTYGPPQVWLEPVAKTAVRVLVGTQRFQSTHRFAPSTGRRGISVSESRTIRIDGEDGEPGFIDPGEYTPRCRLYATTSGLDGLPQRR